MTSCAFCGRLNDAASRFCIDCGKPLQPSAARTGPAYAPAPAPNASGAPPQPVPISSNPAAARAAAAAPAAPRSAGSASVIPPTRVSDAPGTCQNCGKAVDPTLPFCAHCGGRVADRVSIDGVPSTVARSRGTEAFRSRRTNGTATLALLGEAADVIRTFTLDSGEAIVGRGDVDIRFESDPYMSPMHARLDVRDGQLWLRDLGSRNGSWIFIEQPTKLVDGDQILLGSQILRFRRLGYPGPHPPEADSTRRMGSLVPTADVAVLEQVRADGSVRDILHLSPGRSMLLGRETGDWVFPYDQTMSARHAEVRSEDSEFWVHDAGSRNGVAMAVRGERALRPRMRILLGDQILRVESL